MRSSSSLPPLAANDKMGGVILRSGVDLKSPQIDILWSLSLGRPMGWASWSLFISFNLCIQWRDDLIFYICSVSEHGLKDRSIIPWTKEVIGWLKCLAPGLDTKIKTIPYPCGCRHDWHNGDGMKPLMNINTSLWLFVVIMSLLMGWGLFHCIGLNSYRFLHVHVRLG